MSDRYSEQERQEGGLFSNMLGYGPVRRVAEVATMIAAMASVACGGDGGGITDPNPDPESPPGACNVSGPGLLYVGESGTYTASASPTDGDPITRWSFSPSPSSQDNNVATFSRATPGTFTVSCRATDDDGTGSSGTTRTVTVAEETAEVDAVDIDPIGTPRVGERSAYLLIGNGGDWSVTGNGVSGIEVRADTAFATVTSRNHSLTATLTRDGQSDTYSENFTAAAAFIEAALNFVYGPLDPGGDVQGTVEFENGKVIDIQNGRAVITKADSIDAGVSAIIADGQLQRQKRWVNLQDGRAYILEVVGPNDSDYDIIAKLTTWGDEGTRKIDRNAVFLVDDAGHWVVENTISSRYSGEDSPSEKRLKEERIADVEHFRVNIFADLTANVYSASLVRATADDSDVPNRLGDEYPAGLHYVAAGDGITNAIAHGNQLDGGIIEGSFNLVKNPQAVTRSTMLSDLAESIGFNTNSSNWPGGRSWMFVSQNDFSPVFYEAGEYLYSDQRPVGSGRLNGFDDFINNQSRPDQPSGNYSPASSVPPGNIIGSAPYEFQRQEIAPVEKPLIFYFNEASIPISIFTSPSPTDF